MVCGFECFSCIRLCNALPLEALALEEKERQAVEL